jgi:predicted acetyltransferase
MWITVNKDELLNTEKYSFIKSDIDNEGNYLIAFYTSYDEWLKDCPSYLDAPRTYFDNKEARDLAFTTLFNRLKLDAQLSQTINRG